MVSARMLQPGSSPLCDTALAGTWKAINKQDLRVRDRRLHEGCSRSYHSGKEAPKFSIARLLLQAWRDNIKSHLWLREQPIERSCPPQRRHRKQEAIARRQGVPARLQSSMCRIGLPDADVGVAPSACRPHDRIEVLPQVGVCGYPSMHCHDVIVERPVKQLFASRQESQPAEFWNPKRAVFALLDAQPGRGMQPDRNGSGDGRLIARKVALWFAEVPGADDDAHHCSPRLLFRLTRPRLHTRVFALASRGISAQAF